jgi:hypothetical protein
LEKKPLHGLGQVARDWIQELDAELDDVRDNGPIGLFSYIPDPVPMGASFNEGNAYLNSLLALAD